MIAFLVYKFILPILVLPIIMGEVRRDYRSILADGSKASLKGKWHRQSLTWVVAGAVLMCLPLLALGARQFAAGVFLMGAIFWFVFDLWLSIKLEKSITYVGQTAYLDVFFHRFKNPELVMLICKVIYLNLACSLYF